MFRGLFGSKVEDCCSPEITSGGGGGGENMKANEKVWKGNRGAYNKQQKIGQSEEPCKYKTKEWTKTKSSKMGED